MNYTETRTPIDPNRELTHLSDEDKRMIGSLQEDKLANRALNAGSVAPNFSAIESGGYASGDVVSNFQLSDQNNRKQSLSTLLLNRKAVLVNFYRGMWCPFCNLELRSLQKHIDTFEKHGVGIAAISPQSPDNSLTTIEKNSLKFAVLSDLENVVAKQFGISFQVPEYLLNVYAGFGLDLAQYNGVSPVELPLPATYIIDQHRVIRHAFVQEDFTKRADINEILEAVKKI